MLLLSALPTLGPLLQGLFLAPSLAAASRWWSARCKLRAGLVLSLVDSALEILSAIAKPDEQPLSIQICMYVYICICICYPPQRPTFCMISPPKTLFRAVFVVDAKHAPHRPIFCMTPPAGKVRVQVLCLLRPLLSVFVSVFIIRIVISIILIIHKHDYYHCHCPCHVPYQYHHTYCKMNSVTISMILVLLLAC